MIFLFLFVILIVYKAEFTARGFRDCLSKSTTASVRGICTLVVILHHLAQKCQTEELFSMIFWKLGFLAVAMFFFYSGYGLMKRFCSDPDYPDTFLVKRFGAVLVPYLCVIGLYWVVDTLLGEPHTLTEVLRSLINGHPIVTDSWYVLTILEFYLCFYLLMRICGKKTGAIAVGSLLWCAVWVLVCAGAGYDPYWYNAVICIWVGILVAMAEEPLQKIMKKYYVPVWIAAMAVFAAAFCILYRKNPTFLPVYVGLHYLCEIAFIAVVLLVTMKFGTKNRVWDFLSRISLEAYLCHRLFMNLLRSRYIWIQSDSLWGIAVLVLSVAAAYGLHKLFGRMNQAVQKLLLPANR